MVSEVVKFPLFLSEHHFKQVQRFQCQQVTWRVSAWGRVADNSCFMQWASLLDKLQLSPSVRPSGLYCGCVYGWQFTQSLCASKSKGQFISFNVTNTHWHTGTHTHICPLFISECVCMTVCNSRCVWGIWGPGNCVEITLGFLWLISESWETTLTKNNRNCAGCSLTTQH